MRIVTLILALLSTHLDAVSIHRCLGSEGEPVFADTHCGGPAHPVTLGRPALEGDSVSLAESQQQLKRLRAIPEFEADRRKPVPRGTGPLGFAERTELRRLEIRADGLRRDLARGGRSHASRQAMTRELAEAARRIRELRSRQAMR